MTTRSERELEKIIVGTKKTIFKTDSRNVLDVNKQNIDSSLFMEMFLILKIYGVSYLTRSKWYFGRLPLL